MRRRRGKGEGEVVASSKKRAEELVISYSRCNLKLVCASELLLPGDGSGRGAILENVRNFVYRKDKRRRANLIAENSAKTQQAQF